MSRIKKIYFTRLVELADGRAVAIKARICPYQPALLGLPAEPAYIETCSAHWVMGNTRLNPEEHAEHIDETWVLAEALKEAGEGAPPA